MKRFFKVAPVSAGIIVVLVLLIALIAMSGTPASSAINPNTLVSTEVASAPTVDGTAEAIWDNATAITMPVSGGWYGSGNVTMKSVYNGGNVYFLVQYADPDRSNRRAPWHKNSDGSWTHIPARSAAQSVYNGTTYGYSHKDPDGAYEDKFAIMWNTTGASQIAGFNEGAGCAVNCHWAQGLGGSGDYGRMYNNNAGEIGDIWHFKSVRTAPVTSETSDGAGGVYLIGQVDDQYIDNCKGTQGGYVGGDPACDGDWGRHGDPKTGGGYSNNQNGTNTLPSNTSATQPANGTPAHPYYIKKSEETAWADTFSPGDEVAGIRISPLAGDRGQISSGAHYNAVDHTWTVEFSRPLVTPDQANPAIPSTKDVQFGDLNGEYFFGLAVMDNAQTEHSTSGGVNKMVFSGHNADDKVYYMPWFDNNSSWGMVGDWINIANMGPGAITTKVEVGGVSLGTYDLAAGEIKNVTAPPNTVGGMVEVACSHCQTSDDSLAVTQRTLFKNSFNEVGSMEKANLGSKYSFPWYDNNAAWGMMGDWIIVGNASDTDAMADIYIGNLNVPMTTLSVPAGGVQFYRTPGPTYDGPVKVAALGTQKLVVSQRVIYLDSFNEALGSVTS